MSKTLCGDRWLSLIQDDDDTVYVHSGDGVMIVPLTAHGNVILITEPSPAFGGEPTLVLPGGEVEADEPTAETANRELQEEIGFRAARLDLLGELRPWSKYLHMRLEVYLARRLTPATLQGDEPYTIGVEACPLAAFEALIEAGRLRDSSAIAALYLARRFLEKEKVSS